MMVMVMMMIMNLVIMILNIMLMVTNPLLAAPSGGPMNSLRKWLYRPRRDDKSLLAKFW